LESVKCLADEDRNKLEDDGYERANELLCKNGTVVVIIAHRLEQRGYMTATEFKDLTLRITAAGRKELAEKAR
jgi:hypothetical protein